MAGKKRIITKETCGCYTVMLPSGEIELVRNPKCRRQHVATKLGAIITLIPIKR